MAIVCPSVNYQVNLITTFTDGFAFAQFKHMGHSLLGLTSSVQKNLFHFGIVWAHLQKQTMKHLDIDQLFMKMQSYL